MNEKQAKRIRRAARDAIAEAAREGGGEANPYAVHEVISDAEYVIRAGAARMSHRQRGKLGDILRGVVCRVPLVQPGTFGPRLGTVVSVRPGPNRLHRAARYARKFVEGVSP